VSLVQKQTVKINGPVRDITVTWLGKHEEMMLGAQECASHMGG